MTRKLPTTCGVAIPRRPFPALPLPAPRKAPVRRPGARPAPSPRAKAPEAVPVRPRALLGLPAPAAAPPRSMLPPFPGSRARGPLAHLVGVPRAVAPRTVDLYPPGPVGMALRAATPRPKPAKAALMRAAPGNIRGVYLSSAEGVPFWFGKLVDWAQHDSDNPVEDGMVPVVLRVTTTCDTVEDTIGSRDAMSDAVVCSRPIVPGAIRVWDGEKWTPLSWEVDPRRGARWVEDEDFDEGGYAELLGPYESPLVPRL